MEIIQITAESLTIDRLQYGSFPSQIAVLAAVNGQEPAQSGLKVC